MWRRRLTAPWRGLPDFLLIGAMKAGTSSLYYYLTRHPQVLQAARKEVHYFDMYRDRPLVFYRQFFPLAAKLRRRGALTGESSPGYMYLPEIPPMIRERLGPEVSFIAVLRDPVERAISHYGHLARWPGETRPIEMYLEHVPSRDEGYMLDARDPCGWRYRPHRNDIIARGIYDVQLRRYIETFGRDRLHVMLFEELLADPAGELDRAFGFLGVSPARVNTEKVLNAGHQIEVAPAVRQRLAERFAPANSRLEDLLDRSLPWQ
jgi:hypothetical protein